MLITTSLSFTLLLLSCFSFSPPCTLSALPPPCVPTVPAMWPPCCHPASALAAIASGSSGSGVMAGSRGRWQCHNPGQCWHAGPQGAREDLPANQELTLPIDAKFIFH